MISVTEAIQKIRDNLSPLDPVNSPLANVCGLVLAADVHARVSLPNFNQSAMDGYAFRFADYQQTKELTISGEVAAGDTGMVTLPPYHAVRIFTGAAVPQGLDTVVMQEKTAVKEGKLIVLDEQLQEGSNVRLKGAEINKGDLALIKGTLLTPAAVGYLAGIGITEVTVYPKPAVHIIVTGKELVKPGESLKEGQIYESNSLMLQAALEQLGIRNVTAVFADDDVTEISSAIAAALENADLILLSGGVSVGNYDFVVPSAEACGVEQLFHKVAQRPGKPLYVGRKGRRIVFGLPGNPASVLTCFYNYVIAALEELTGRKALLEKRHLPLLTGISKTVLLTQFLKASCNTDGVMPLSAQESFRLSSFSVANALIILPEGTKEYNEGEIVEVLLLPYL